LKIFTLAILLVILVQDLKSRAVYWILFPVLIIVLLLLNYFQYRSLSAIWQPVLINMGFLLLQLILVSAYFSIKHGRWINITDSLLGLGDILFLLSVASYLSAVNFLFFYVVSLILILFGWLVWQPQTGKKDKTIPLAGMQALLFMLFLAAGWGLKLVDLTQDTWLLNLITR
jgi:hypothetical protein